MIDRQIRRACCAAVVVALSLALSATSGHAFPQSTETSGEITPDLNGTWFVVNRMEFPYATPQPGATPNPGPSPKAQGGVRPFTVGYVFTIKHLPTSQATKLRDAEKEMKQAALEKANRILAEELKKSGPPKAAEGETPIEPKAMSYGIPKAADSVVDLHDEVAVELLDVELPKTIQDAIDQANKAEKVWEPSEKDLALLKSSWKTLKPRAKTEYSRIQWKVLQDKYLDGGMLQDEKTKNAKFVISGDAALVATPGQPNRSILVYGADKVSDNVIEGGHVRAIMTASPFPIPIDMKGVFKMIRLTDVPKASAQTDTAKKGENKKTE
jgi:hypothetical protein